MSPRFSPSRKDRRLYSRIRRKLNLPTPLKKQKQKNTVVTRRWKCEYLPSELKSDVIKVTTYSWKEIISLLL